MLRPSPQVVPSALMLARRAECHVRLRKPNAAVRDCDAALGLNPDSGKVSSGLSATTLPAPPCVCAAEDAAACECDAGVQDPRLGVSDAWAMGQRVEGALTPCRSRVVSSGSEMPNFRGPAFTA